jgi:ElaB/YqjD/DUF883 family membrane-anchored ribosome-binding protein
MRNDTSTLAFAGTAATGKPWALTGAEVEEMRTQRNGVIEAAEEAQGAVVEAAQTVKDTAADLGAKAQQYAAEAGRQVGAAAQTVYGSGNEVADLVEGLMRKNVWASVLIAGAVGYGVACLVKSSR